MEGYPKYDVDIDWGMWTCSDGKTFPSFQKIAAKQHEAEIEAAHKKPQMKYAATISGLLWGQPITAGKMVDTSQFTPSQLQLAIDQQHLMPVYGSDEPDCEIGAGVPDKHVLCGKCAEQMHLHADNDGHWLCPDCLMVCHDDSLIEMMLSEAYWIAPAAKMTTAVMKSEIDFTDDSWKLMGPVPPADDVPRIVILYDMVLAGFSVNWEVDVDGGVIEVSRWYEACCPKADTSFETLLAQLSALDPYQTIKVDIIASSAHDDQYSGVHWFFAGYAKNALTWARKTIPLKDG